MRHVASWVVIGLIRAYQWSLGPLLSALFGRQCRFEPSCSVYAADAVREWGVIRGLALTGKRLARCNPLCKGGYDPVPPNPRR